MTELSPQDQVDFQALFEAAPGLYLVLRPDLMIVAVSDAYLAATMTRREDILGRGIFDVFPDNPDDPAATGVSNLRASLERARDLGRPDAMAVQKYDVRRPAAEGGGFEERYWSPVNSPVVAPDGRVAWIIHQVEDVTEFMRLQQQEARQEQENDDLRARTARMQAEILRRAQELQESNRALRDSEERLRQLNETLEQRVRERSVALEMEVRERERAQEALRENQKLEAIGRLTGAIAHDFNNLLTVILGNAELLLGAELDDEASQTVSQIDRAASAGARLTRQLLAFSRQQALRPERLDLGGRAQEMGDLLRRSLRGDIRMVVSLPDDLWPIECDSGELDLALLNICVNARDAMSDGGVVRLEGRNVRLPFDAAGAALPVALSGDFVAITVSDTGAGIPAEAMTRVFEPFFTTKEVGKGTGLGLAQVLGFTQQAGGTAMIDSEPGIGTAVTLYLPRATGTAIAEAQDDAAVQPRGVGTVLLVEDDDEVASVAGRMLHLIGYSSQRVADARTALAILIGGTRFDLVFADIVMPGGMSGIELARKIRQHFPAQPVLLASGYSQAAAEVARENLPIIAKPYRADALADAIRQCLMQAEADQADTA